MFIKNKSKFHEKSLTQACDFFQKMLIWERKRMLESEIFHEIVTCFLWKIPPINEHLKLRFCQVFESMIFLIFKCSFAGRTFQKKISRNFMKIPWLKHVTFFKKRHFSKIRLREIYKVVITKHSYLTLFRTPDLEKF